MQQRRLKIFNGKMVQLQGAVARHLGRKRNPLLHMAMLWRVCLRQRRKVVCSVFQPLLFDAILILIKMNVLFPFRLQAVCLRRDLDLRVVFHQFAK